MTETKRIRIKMIMVLEGNQETIDSIIKDGPTKKILVNHPAVVECFVESVQDITAANRLPS